ncbi:MAG: hypothetical protein OXU78_07135, partial [Deltaproteobacteria bacterium]|nr:hypothetical protein [Deltaproteobacteria bacterium]
MQSFNVTLRADDLNEGNETFTLSFSIATEHMAAATANGGVTVPGDHTVTITDNADDAISVSIAESNTDADMTTTGKQVREGRVALFTVTLSKVSTAAVSVPYSISGDVAAADYTDAGGGTLSIPAGLGGLAPTTGVIRIELAIDSDMTAEDLTVTLGATASEYSAAGTIARSSTTAQQSATISVVSRPSTALRTLTVTPAAGPHPEGDANANHTFTISFASGDTAFTSNTEVTWTINHGSTDADDFTETSGLVTILADSTADVDFMVTIVGDNVNEANESFGVSLTAPDAMTELGDDPNDSSMVVIADDDAIVLTFSGDGPVAEEDGRVVVMLDFGAVLSRPMVVRVGSTMDDDANTPNAEFVDLGETGTAWLPASPPALHRGQIGNALFEFDRGAGDDPISGTTTGQIPIPTLVNDNDNEANEVFLVRLEEAPSGAYGPVTLVGHPAIFTIVDDDAMTLSVTTDKSTVNEGQDVQFSFQLTGAGGTRADLDLSYTLTGASGFTPQVSGDHSDGVFRFGDREVSGAIVVTIPRLSALGDSDPDQTLTLTVTSIERADSTVSRGSADEADPFPGVIHLPDPATTDVTVNFVDARHSFGFSSPTRRIGETDGAVTTTYTVSRSGEGGMDISSGGSITITWAYAAGTTNPVSDMDFMGDTAPMGGTLVFTGSETSETFDIVTKGDNLNEADETFTLTLSIASGDQAAATTEMGASVPTSGLTVAIADDDLLGIMVSSASASVTEGADIVLTVEPFGATPTVDIVFPYGFVPVGGSAASVSATAADYTDTNGGSITIASSASSGTITINIVDDDLNEAEEALRFASGSFWSEAPTAAGAVNVTGAQIPFTLMDNDNALLSIAADTTSTGEGETAAFTVTTDHESAGDILVAWTAAVSGEQGTANPMSNPDLGLTSGTATITAGGTTASIEIPVRFDNVDEGATAETLTVTLGAVSFPSGLNAAGTVTVDSTNNSDTMNLQNLNAARSIAAEVASATVEEGGDIEFQIVVRGRPITQAFNVDWSLTAGTAEAADYSPASGTVSFTVSSSTSANEVRTQRVRVTAVDDAMMEGAETLSFSFTDPCPAMGVCAVGGRPSGFPGTAPTMEAGTTSVTATITASDSPVTLQISGPGNALEEALSTAQPE